MEKPKIRFKGYQEDWGQREHDVDISDGIVEKCWNYKLYMWTIWSAYFGIILYVKACFRLSVTTGRTIGN